MIYTQMLEIADGAVRSPLVVGRESSASHRSPRRRQS
jgi:hypothetical protein